jgi:hypothetical protein
MGTWGTGPFDNDTAADFAAALDKAAPEERPELIRGALATAANSAGHLDDHDGGRAVAAAALVAARCSGGEPADSVYGPNEELPGLTGLRDLAAAALDRVLGPHSETAELWDESGGSEWHTETGALLAILRPGPEEDGRPVPGDGRETAPAE